MEYVTDIGFKLLKDYVGKKRGGVEANLISQSYNLDIGVFLQIPLFLFFKIE